MMRKLLVVSIAAATSTIALPGNAQTGIRNIEEIEVFSTTRRTESLGDINASVAVLSEEELRQIAHTHFQEAANRLPGVNISRNSGQESLTAIRSPVLTGAGACGSFLLAEQGIPLRSAGFCNVNEMFDSHTENASRIEVIRGPGSAFYGSNAIHGMINVVLPQPEERMEIGLEAGPWGFYRANAIVGFDNGDFKHMVLASGTSGDGFQDDSGVDQQKLSWVYQYTTAGGWNLDGGFTRTNLNQETGGYVYYDGFPGVEDGTAGAYKDDDVRDTNLNPEAYRDNESLRVWTRFSKELDNDWEVVFTPYFREANLNFIMHFLPGTPTEDNEHRSLGAQFASYKTLDANSTLAVGLDVESTTGRLYQFQENAIGGGFLARILPQGAHYDYEVDAFQIAPFAHYQRYFDNGWDISLGLRYEQMDYEYDNLMIDGRTDQNGVACPSQCRYSRPSDRDDDFGNWSPKFGVRYQINDRHNVQARVQRGFRAPQATELYRLQVNQTVADLDSVELDSYELALQGGADRWEYSITGFFMNKDNEIIQDSSRANVNDVETEHKGVELAGSYQLSDTLLLSGAYNIARHTYENDLNGGALQVKGNDVDTAPRRFGNLRLSWQATSAITTELEWVNMGKYYTRPENTTEYEGHDLFNLRTNWNVNPDLRVALNILNVFDEDYAERADWTTFNGNRYFVGQPVRAFLSVNWSMN